MKKKLHGKCAICGETKELTEEHISPKCSFNNQKVQVYNSIKITGENPKVSQNGFKIHTLCEDCNGNTGGWYGTAYRDFVNQLTPTFTKYEAEAGHMFVGDVKNIYPARVLKQILSMFCSVNCGDARINTLRDFVKNPRATLKNPNFHLYMWLNGLIEGKIHGKIMPFRLIVKDADLSFYDDNISEIITYPVGYMLCLNSTDELSNRFSDLPNIAEFINYSYDDKCDLKLGIPVKQRLSPYVGDFGSKD